MLLGKKNNDSEENDEDNELLIMSYIQQANFDNALDLLDKSEESFFTTYNKILCLFYEGNLEKALELIKRAQDLLFVINNSEEVIDPLMLFEIGTKSLDGEKSYLDSVSTKYASLFPNEMKDNLLRLQFDILLKQSNWNQIKKLEKDNTSESILQYSNVKNAISEANKYCTD